MNEQSRQIFSGMQLLIDRQWKTNQALIVEDKFIKAILPEEMIKHHLPARRYEFPRDHYLVPGFIDLHVHGVHGYDVMDASEEAVFSISKSLAAEGITGFLATTMTDELQKIEEVLQVVSKVIVNPENTAVLGIHLEGPFISETKSGAHLEQYCQLPKVELMQKWQQLTQNAIKLVTLAPELPGALHFIRVLRQMGIIASIGHTNATYKETVDAINAGCTQATHLFNAMRGIHQREPGPTVALLLDSLISAELIVDGVHLAPSIIELCFKLKGKDHLFLVTDAMRAKCLKEGYYEFGGQKVEVKNGKVSLSDGTLAGSMLKMNDAIKNMVKFSYCSLIDAINMASYNPAHALGIDKFKGSISVGKLADLVILNADLKVMMTMREGKQVYQGS